MVKPRKTKKTVAASRRVKRTLPSRIPRRPPARKPKPAPRKMERRVSRVARVPRPINLLNADTLEAIPSGRPVGKATALNSQMLYNFPIPVDGYRRMFVVTNTGHSATVAVQLQTNGTSPGTSAYHVPIYNQTPAAGGPTSGRCMKAGIHITNCTADIRAGGRVFVLHCDQRVALPTALTSMTGAQMTALFDTVMNHPDTQSYSGKSFQGGSETFSTHVVDAIEYETFRPWIGQDTIDSFGNHPFLYTGGPGILDDGLRPMSTVFVLFEQPADPQDYVVRFRHSIYSRWTLGTIGSLTMKDVAVASPGLLNRIFSLGQR